VNECRHPREGIRQRHQRRRPRRVGRRALPLAPPLWYPPRLDNNENVVQQNCCTRALLLTNSKAAETTGRAARTPRSSTGSTPRYAAWSRRLFQAASGEPGPGMMRSYPCAVTRGPSVRGSRVRDPRYLRVSGLTCASCGVQVFTDSAMRPCQPHRHCCRLPRRPAREHRQPAPCREVGNCRLSCAGPTPWSSGSNPLPGRGMQSETPSDPDQRGGTVSAKRGGSQPQCFRLSGFCLELMRVPAGLPGNTRHSAIGSQALRR